MNYASLQPLQYLYLFASGAVAICAMVLPGISGSSILLIAGVYLPTVQAARSLLHLDLAVLPGLIALELLRRATERRRPDAPQRPASAAS